MKKKPYFFYELFKLGDPKMRSPVVGIMFFPWEKMEDGSRTINFTVGLFVFAFSIGVGLRA